MHKEVIHHHSDSTKSTSKYLLAVFSVVITEKELSKSYEKRKNWQQRKVHFPRMFLRRNIIEFLESEWDILKEKHPQRILYLVELPFLSEAKVNTFPSKT